MNRYYLQARLAPTILTAIPLISVYLFIVSPYVSNYLKVILPMLPLIGDISFSAAFVFILVQLNRTLSKELLQSRFFKGETKMPTTDFLLYNNEEYSTETKDRIRRKIKDHFNMELFDSVAETANEGKSRVMIKDCVGQIRVLLTENKMLLNHNIEYGALRNFLGGCIQAILFSLVLIGHSAFAPFNKGIFIFSCFLLTIYTVPLFVSKWLMQRYGNNYARILYQQFLSVPTPISTQTTN